MRGAEFDRIQPNSLDNGAKISYNEYNKYSKTISKIVAARLLNAEIHNERKMNMKKTNHNSPTKRIAASATMLAVSAAMLGTSTYAWFTMNKEVSVTGMQMNTKVSENLLIAPDEIANNTKLPDSAFHNALVDTKSGLLEPVSTVNGVNYFYTAGTNVQGNGSVINTKWSTYDPEHTAAFANEYALKGNDATDAKGYIDYVYQLKAVNGSTASKIRLTQLDLNYGGAKDNDQKASRVAVFVENLGYVTSAGSASGYKNPSGSIGTLSSIFSAEGAENFSKTEGPSNTTDDAVSGETARADVNVPNTAVALEATANATSYYKIVVRVWIEGEDKTCNNATFMDLTDKWSLDMRWDLEADSNTSTNPAVSNLSLNTTTTKTDLSNGPDVTANTVVIDSVTYYEINGVVLGTDTKLYKTANSAVAAGDRIYKIVNNHPYDVTNQCTLPTT